MDADSILSGFIGSFLGVAAGFLGAVYLDWRRSPLPGRLLAGLFRRCLRLERDDLIATLRFGLVHRLVRFVD